MFIRLLYCVFEGPGLAASLLQAHGFNLTYTVTTLITSVWIPAYMLPRLSQIDLELAGLSIVIRRGTPLLSYRIYNPRLRLRRIWLDRGTGWNIGHSTEVRQRYTT